MYNASHAIKLHCTAVYQMRTIESVTLQFTAWGIAIDIDSYYQMGPNNIKTANKW